MMNKKIIIITDNSPTPIVKDFKTYLTYLSANKMKLTKASAYFTKKDLIALYNEMKTDEREVPENATQLQYPILHLFYHLSITLGFFKVRRTQTTASAIIQKERIDEFLKMTPTEQYVTLLEAFWMELDWKELQGEKWGTVPDDIDFLFVELETIPENEEIVLSENEEVRFRIERYGQFLFYFHYFGLWELTIDEEKTKNLFRSMRTYAKSITLTPFFKVIQEDLFETWNPSDHYLLDHPAYSIFNQLFGFSDGLKEVEEEEIEVIPLSEQLRPLFSEAEFTSIMKKEQPQYKKGNYLFKIALSSSCWRTVQLSSEHTLLDLHHLIQEAFDFDDDHLYAFYMDGKSFSKSCYNSPMDSRGPYVHKVKVGELSLSEKQHFLYLFDFGDEWEFDVELIEYIEGEVSEDLEIVEEEGESPEQYPGYSF